MFTITDFGGQEKVVENMETINNFGRSTQLRIYDLLTGIYSRILPQTDGKYTLAESGISPKGFLSDFYEITEELDIDADSIELNRQLLSQINGLNLTSDEVDYLLTNGFLHVIEQKNPESSSIDGFKEILDVEQLAYEIEQSGCIAYQNVVDEINRRLSMDSISDDERKNLTALKNVYENSLFRQAKENSKVLQEQQRIKDKMHSAEEISADLQEIGRSQPKQDALRDITESGKNELQMSDYGFDENGLMFGEYGIEQIESMYESFKDEIDENGLPLPSSDLPGTDLAEMLYNYTRYLKDKAKIEKDKLDENTK